MLLGQKQVWKLAVAWAKSNRVLINHTAGPYTRYMGLSSEDLESEALLVAHQVLLSLHQGSKNLSDMERYFRVVFRSHCIRLTRGYYIAEYIDPEKINLTNDQKISHQQLDQLIIDGALEALTARQREVTEWILCQSFPVNTERIGSHFGISSRAARKLIKNAIIRLENGHRRIRKTVGTVT